ncbi:hypothetical protein PSHT_05691 [Puccinia striiformis]|uniref:Uncharacterized protein n=1 Tax=Puccinia striiformis TaxID=27350 RepID=A0A2S4W9W3_9BASI|nr:hypothetical protein PSHT_05691 [Puccinia striiformis]
MRTIDMNYLTGFSARKKAGKVAAREEQP